MRKKIPLDKKSIYFSNKDSSFILLQGNCIEILNNFPEKSVDMIFADPPYFLSNGGITCKAGKMVSVNKGEWDKSKGVKADHQFHLDWLRACQRVLTDNGTVWVSGTNHVIYSVGYAMHELGFKMLNDIVWYKRNAPPNLSCRYFTHSTETVLWAAKNKKSKHCFNYELMKEMNRGKQMRNVWEISAPSKDEKRQGKHPTQKPLSLLYRIILASTKKGDLVLDPFNGGGSTGIGAKLLDRNYVGVELEKQYLDLTVKRFKEINKNVKCKLFNMEGA
ncbi:DNA-methyltransferase [Candidatus Margulisiibacteriota bacterium]